MKKELENYEQWLVQHDTKKESSANSYKIAIPKLEEHYRQFTGRDLNFLKLSVEELNPIVQAYRQDGKYAEFGDTSNGTYRSSLNALLRYKEWQQKSIEPSTPLKILHLLQTPHFQELLAQKEFYYQKLTDLYEEYKNLDTTPITEEINGLLHSVTQGTFTYQALLDNAEGILKEYLLLLGRMIAVFDEKGYNKQLWNPYEDKRNVSRSMVNQRDWTRFLLGYKQGGFAPEYLQSEKLLGLKYTISFIEDPEHHVNMVSKNHRKDVRVYFDLSSDEELITLFSKELETLGNPKNRGLIISQLLYNSEIKKDWIRSINGIMASDGTGWLPRFALASKSYNHCVLWNTKKPSGGRDTLHQLRSIIDRGDEFMVYYASKGYVHYVAYIKDFAGNAEEYKDKAWNKNIEGDIHEYEPLFENYVEENKKASIVFLSSGLYKIEPISVDEFEVYGNFSLPRQDNLSPIKSEPAFQILEIEGELEIKKDKPKIEFQAPLNQILYGPPGTGKTYKTILEAAKIITSNETISYAKALEVFNEQLKEQIEFVTFHQNYSYEDFIQGLRPETDTSGTLSFYKKDGVFKKIADRALKNYKISKETEDISLKNYVIIIDEINRANISRVFGELITLIEKDKRYGDKIPLTATLPSGESFIVPPNLYIIGTMNTADKSIALLDIALRRRFEFRAMYPKYQLENNNTINDTGLLEKINIEIIKRKGHDFTIGHAYFMGGDYSLENTMNNKVIPLLLEYFMNDEKEVKSILELAGIEVEGWPMQYKRND